MRFSDLFLLSTRMFKARTSRTLLTILGMSVGIGAIVFLVSLGYGLQKTLLEKITTADSLLTLDVSPDPSKNSILDESSLAKFQEIGNVAEISPSFQVVSQGKLGDLTADLPVTVVKPDYLKLQGIKLNEGNFLNNATPNGIIISSAVTQIFGKNMDEIIGQNMTFVFFLRKEEDLGKNASEISKEEMKKYEARGNFRIIGVIESDDNTVYANAEFLSDIKPSRYDQVKVKCANDKVMGEIRGKIEEQGFLVSSLSETVDQANKVFRIIKIVLMLFGVIALVVSAIGMFNTMTIALLERTEEIGIMKSIGASDNNVSMIFIMESTIMGFLGGLAGVIIGWLEGLIANTTVNFVATHFGGEKVSLFSSPAWFILLVIVFSAVVGLLTGVIPARRASGLDPLDALRYK